MRPAAGLVLAALAGPALADSGADRFAKLCAGCHKADGTGVPGFGPPLKGGLAPILAKPGGIDYVVRVLLNGMTGPISSMGKTYNGAMPAFAAHPDDTIAAVLDHVVGTLNGAEPPDAADVAAWRSSPLSPDKVTALRGQVLGEP
jgi:mono/diheme cytochrome c family protein